MPHLALSHSKAGPKMPDLRIPDLRHSFASTEIMDNVPLATIGKLLGHLLPHATRASPTSRFSMRLKEFGRLSSA